MNGTCHKIVGASVGAIVASSLGAIATSTVSPGITPLIVGVTAAEIGSLFPDVDKRGSKASHKAPITSTLTEMVLGHRGVIHTPLMAIILSLFVYAICAVILGTGQTTNMTALTFFAGYMSHLFLDTLNPSGTMLLYPISKKRFHIFGINGKLVELMIEVIFVAIAAYVVLY